jgi:hypothetical protein
MKIVDWPPMMAVIWRSVDNPRATAMRRLIYSTPPATFAARARCRMVNLIGGLCSTAAAKTLSKLSPA